MNSAVNIRYTGTWSRKSKRVSNIVASAVVTKDVSIVADTAAIQLSIQFSKAFSTTISTVGSTHFRAVAGTTGFGTSLTVLNIHVSFK